VNASKTKCAVTWNLGRANRGRNASAVTQDHALDTNVVPADEVDDSATPHLNTPHADAIESKSNDVIANGEQNVDDTTCCPDMSESKSNTPDTSDFLIQIGDLIYDRDEDGLPAKPQWKVVTQGPHRRSCCNAQCEHYESIKPGDDPDPLLIALAPALITATGVTNKPDPKQNKRDCWFVEHVEKCKNITEMLEDGYRIMCRDNYHVCLLSCRKYKKKLRALYCRMRMPRRPMESTCVSQLHVPKPRREAVRTIGSAIQTNTGVSTARPLQEIEPNNACNAYWDEDNTDVLSAPDDRALVVDLARLTGTRAVSEQVREQVVPAIMSRLLGVLPSTDSHATIEANFQARPFGFTFAPAEHNHSIILTAVTDGSASATAGLTEGMRLVSLNGVHVRDTHSDYVRKMLKTTDARSIVLKFELPSPVTEEPSIYHVRHASMATAAAIVGHIETFLGHTHTYEDPRMAETNVLMSALLKCNTNVQPVGSLSSAMSVLQYLSGYLSKNPIELCNFISCIIAARRRCKRYKSTAEDAGTNDRNAKFLGQKVPACVCACACPSVPACACLCLRVPACACVCLSVPACACLCLRVPACACACQLCLNVLACACMCLCVSVRMFALYE
jgi:hypothetical protein